MKGEACLVSTCFRSRVFVSSQRLQHQHDAFSGSSSMAADQPRFSWPYDQSAAEIWYPPGSLCTFRYRNAQRFRHQFYTDLPGAPGSRKVPRSEAFIDVHVSFEVLSTTHAVSAEGVAWITLELHATDRYLDTVTVFTNASRDEHIWICREL